MAGLKHRYLAVKLETKSTQFSCASIKNALYNSLKINFGEYVLSQIDCFDILESHENLGVVIIRCNLSIHKYLCHVICTLGRVGDANVKLSVITVSGILKKARKRLIADKSI